MLAIKSPDTFHHHSGLRAETGKYIAALSNNIAIITSPNAWKAVNPELEKSLQANNIQYQIFFLEGECSEEAIASHTTQIKQTGASLILGIGGGRVLDTAKAAGNRLEAVDVVTFPTIAATCAAWSPVSVIYNAEGGHTGHQVLVRMPVLVLVDTEVIARSDVRYLKSGIVDALAKWYEFQPYQQKNPDILALNLKVAVATYAVDVFKQYGIQAVEDNRHQRVTLALAKVIDANIALAGLCNSMQDDYPAPGVAHAIHNRFTHQPELHGWLHGEKVGFGLLLQSILQNSGGEPDAELLALLQQFDAPRKLPELQGDRAETLQSIAQQVIFADQYKSRLPFVLTPSSLLSALQQTESRHY